MKKETARRASTFIKVAALAFGLAVAGITQSAQAADTWSGAANSTWDTTSANWNAGGTFTNADDALFTGTPTRNVTTATGLTIGSITLNNTFTGSVALTGNNTVNGATTISGGTLSLVTATGLGTSAVTVNSGGKLALNANTGADITYANTVAGAGTVQFLYSATGGHDIFLNNLGSFTGTIELSLGSGQANTAGKARFGAGTGGPTINASSSLIIDSGTQLYMAGTGTTTFASIQVSGIGNTELRGAIRSQSGILTGAISLMGDTTIGTEGGTISGSISSGVSGTQTLTLGTTNSVGNLTLTSNIGGGTGTIALTKTQAGTTTLSGTNTYTGVTTISAGTLQVGNGSTTGTLGSGSVTNNATLTFNRSDDITVANNITNSTAGAGTLTKQGAGKLTLSGTNSLGSNLNVTAGSVDITGSTTTDGGAVSNQGYLNMVGTVGVTISSGGSLNILGSTNGSGPNSIVGQNAAGTSTLTVNGGSLTIGANTGFALGNNIATANGVLTISSGTATITRGSLTATDQRSFIAMGKDLGNGTINLNGGTLATDRNFVRDGGSSTANGGTATFNFGGGTLKALANQTDWLNSTTINTWQQALSSVTATNTSTIDANGFSVAINSAISGAGGFNINSSTGSGVVTFGGANSYLGATNVNSGKLLINGNQSTATGAVTVASGATLGGSGTIGGATTIQNGGTINAGTVGTVGTLTLNNVTFQSGSNFNIDYSGSTGSNTVDRLTITGAAAGTSSGTTITFNQVASSGSLTLGNYILATAGSGTGLNTGNFTTSTLPTNYHLVNNSATELDLQHEATISLALGSNAANVHVGGQTVNLTVGNTAPTGSTNLNYTLGGVTGSGTVAAGGAPATTGSYTAAAGVNSFNITASDANATNSPQTVAFSQTGYNLASAATSQTVNVGNTHVGVAKTASATITNSAPVDATYTETLSSNGFSGTTSNFTATGSISGVAGGSNGTVTVGLGSGLSAGAASGSTVLALNSNAVNGSGLGTTGLTAQTITITGGVYNLAAAAGSQTVNVGAYHVGTGATAAVTLNNTAPADATYTETLQTNGFSGTTANFTATGSASNIVGGGSGSGTLLVGAGGGLGSGVQSGSTTLALQSNEVNSSGLGTTNIGNQVVTITGTGYNLAAASAHSPEPVSFGVVHVGGVASQALTISNSAPGSFSEKLNASFGGATSGITASGSFSLLAAGSSDSTSLVAGIDTSTAGSKSGTATIALVSDGTGTSGLGTTNLASQTVNVSGQVFNGNAKWTGVGSAWGSGASANWVDSNGINAAPGTFAGFDNVDSATFDNTGTANTTVNLSGATPSLKAVTFNSSASYTIAGGSDTLTMKSDAGNATITDSNGSHTISANVTLASDTTVNVVNSGDLLTVSGNIGGINGIKGLVKTGAGTLNTTGANTYDGTTTVSGGTLLVNGTHNGAGAYDVQSSGILGGAGSITTASNAGITLQAGGKLSPGSASGLTGTLTANLGSGVFDISAGVNASNTQSLLFDLTTTAASDRVLLSNASSTLNIGSGVLEFNDFVFTTGGGFGVGVYTLFDTNNTITGTLGGNLTGSFGALTGIISFSNANQDIILTVTAIPEPATYGALAGLVLTGLSLTSVIRRRKTFRK